MAGTLRFFWDLITTIGGKSEATQGVLTPVKEVTLPDERRFCGRLLLPKKTGATTTFPIEVFAYDNGQANFTALVIQAVDQAGYFRVQWLADQGVSAPAGGASSRVQEVDCSCHLPFILHTHVARTNPVLATAAGLSGGKPAMGSSVDTALGRIWKVWCENDSQTADMEVDVWLVN
jgi:hypothetical protein